MATRRPRTEDRHRREQAAKAAAQEAADTARRRDMRVRLIGGLATLLVAAAIIVVALIARHTQTPTAGSGTVPAAADQATGAYTYNPGTAATATVELWEDFQCPWCGQFETKNIDTLTQLADAGKIRLITHPAAFLDQAHPGNHSTRALTAWGAAIDLNEKNAWQLRRLIFTHQPANEGAGWTDQQLLDLARQAGFTGADIASIETALTTHSHDKWAQTGTDYFFKSGITSTPTVWFDGQPVPSAIVDGPGSAFSDWLQQQLTSK